MSRFSLLALLACVVVSPASAETTYWQDVRPILRKNCTVCHNPRNIKEADISGGLTLDTYEAVLKWKAKKIALIKPGNSKDSRLFKVIVTTKADKRMPQGEKPLPADIIAVLKKWIDDGAREGKKPAVVEVAPTRPIKRRKLDVTLATALTPPAPAFPGLARGPLHLTLKVGPLSPVVALAFNPDGKTLAAGSYGQVTIWDLKTGKPLKVLTGVLGAVNDVRFSPDGKTLAVAGGQPSAKGDLRLFDTSDWTLKHVLAGHQDVVASVAFRHDGKQLASASYDSSVRTWDTTKGKLVSTFKMHSDFVHSVAWSPDGKYLYSGSKDRSARKIDAVTGAGKLTFSDREQDVLAIAVSADGKTLVASGLESSLSWWNAETGAKLRKNTGGHRGAVHELAFSKDSKVLVSAGADGIVRVWNGTSGAVARIIPVGSLVYATALRPDGKLVAAGSFDGLVRLFDPATGALRLTLLSLPPNTKDHDWLALTPGGHAAGSDGLVALGRWRMGKNTLDASVVWKGLRKPDAVARALAGQSNPSPSFTSEGKSGN